MARILDVCDAVVARLQTLLPAETITRSYGLTVDPPDPDGRIVYVLPAAFNQADIADRGRDITDYEVAVIVLARSDALPVTNEWADAQVSFVTDQIYAPLQDARADYMDDEKLIPQGAAVRQVFNPDDLAAGLYVAELSFTFREYA